MRGYLDPKPAPLAVFAAEFSSAENPAKKCRLAVFDDVLDFLLKKAQVGIYPALCQLANIHLSASAASVPVESMFSTVGLLANSKCSSIFSIVSVSCIRLPLHIKL